jgi:hypothetical protein
VDQLGELDGGPPAWDAYAHGFQESARSR